MFYTSQHIGLSTHWLDFFLGILLFFGVILNRIGKPMFLFCLLIFGCAGAGSLFLCRPFSSHTVSGGYSLAVVQASRRGGFSCCGVRVLGHVGFSSGSMWAK